MQKFSPCSPVTTATAKDYTWQCFRHQQEGKVFDGRVEVYSRQKKFKLIRCEKLVQAEAEVFFLLNADNFRRNFKYDSLSSREESVAALYVRNIPTGNKMNVETHMPL